MNIIPQPVAGLLSPGRSALDDKLCLLLSSLMSSNHFVDCILFNNNPAGAESSSSDRKIWPELVRLTYLMFENPLDIYGPVKLFNLLIPEDVEDGDMSFSDLFERYFLTPIRKDCREYNIENNTEYYIPFKLSKEVEEYCVINQKLRKQIECNFSRENIRFLQERFKTLRTQHKLKILQNASICVWNDNINNFGYFTFLDALYGQILRTRICECCGFQKHSIDMFNVLNLDEMEDDEPPPEGTSPTRTLSKYLDRYTSKRRIEDGDDCPACNSKSHFEQRIIWKLPKVLCISLECCQMMDSAPLSLNLSKYMIPDKNHSSSSSSYLSKQPTPVYNLQSAIIKNTGTLPPSFELYRNYYRKWFVYNKEGDCHYGRKFTDTLCSTKIQKIQFLVYSLRNSVADAAAVPRSDN